MLLVSFSDFFSKVTFKKTFRNTIRVSNRLDLEYFLYKKEMFFRKNKKEKKKHRNQRFRFLSSEQAICFIQHGDDIFTLRVPLNIIIFLDVFGG